MKISVIVPVYNTPEKYLRPCIESLLAQDYTNFEILIIDDGSNTTCHTLLDEISATDSRIKVFHKPNAGVSSARNFGLAQITGDFLTFMDSDDVLDSHAWTTCMHALTQYNADVVCFGWQDHLADGTRIDHCITNDYSMSVPYKHIEYMKSVVPIEDTHADGTKHVYLPRTDATNQPLLCDSIISITVGDILGIKYGVSLLCKIIMVVSHNLMRNLPYTKINFGLSKPSPELPLLFFYLTSFITISFCQQV